MKHVSIFLMIFMNCLTTIAKEKPLKVLMIGNSYTGHIQKTMDFFAESSPQEIHISYVVPGGLQLIQHSTRKKTLEVLKSQLWDIVILQDQSQTPAYPALRPKFFNGVRAMHRISKNQGARIILYQTWGRRDGDINNIDLVPDYTTMQKLLIEAYSDARTQLKCGMAPVGEQWQKVHDRHPDMFGKLYMNDGSHPSALGAYLAACTIYKEISNTLPSANHLPENVDRNQAILIRKILEEL